jgi:hypothetical protein
VDGVRDHYLGARLREAVRLKMDLLKHRPEHIPEGLELAMTAIDTLERPSGSGVVRYKPISLRSARRLNASMLRRTTSTFHCDIAYSESPAASRPSCRSWYMPSG